MKIVSKNNLLVGTALLTLVSAGLVGCSNFLESNATPQGTLDEGTLSTKSGVEGTLIAAYRALDCPAAGGSWGCAASNWVWGSVAGDDSYKGSTSSDQPPINDIEDITGVPRTGRITSTRSGPLATKAFHEPMPLSACCIR